MRASSSIKVTYPSAGGGGTFPRNGMKYFGLLLASESPVSSKTPIALALHLYAPLGRASPFFVLLARWVSRRDRLFLR